MKTQGDTMDLQRLQQLAEPIFGAIEVSGTSMVKWVNRSDGKYHSLCLSDFRERLEAEYRKLAADEKRVWDIFRRVTGREAWDENTDMGIEFTRIADELSAPGEPTMVEKLKEERDRLLDLCSYEQLFLDALIQFGERLDAIERGKE